MRFVPSASDRSCRVSKGFVPEVEIIQLGKGYFSGNFQPEQ